MKRATFGGRIEMATYKIGDTVRLKSGSPRMTVTGAGRDADKGDVVWTAWFLNGEEKQGYYPAAAVETDNGDPPGGGLAFGSV